MASAAMASRFCSMSMPVRQLVGRRCASACRVMVGDQALPAPARSSASASQLAPARSSACTRAAAACWSRRWLSRRTLQLVVAAPPPRAAATRRRAACSSSSGLLSSRITVSGFDHACPAGSRSARPGPRWRRGSSGSPPAPACRGRAPARSIGPALDGVDPDRRSARPSGAAGLRRDRPSVVASTKSAAEPAITSRRVRRLWVAWGRGMSIATGSLLQSQADDRLGRARHWTGWVTDRHERSRSDMCPLLGRGSPTRGATAGAGRPALK